MVREILAHAKPAHKNSDGIKVVCDLYTHFTKLCHFSLETETRFFKGSDSQSHYMAFRKFFFISPF